MIRRRLAPLGLAGLLLACVAACGEDKVLFEKQSQFNAVIVTEGPNGLRTLWFEKGGARQSVVKVGDPDHIELPYARAMFSGLTFCEKPQRVLIVGLGGGTLPGFLHKHYPQMVIDVVDIDPLVVDVARKYFGFCDDALMKAHVADGRKFIEDCRTPYDVIFLDAFGADSVPYDLATEEFLKAVRKALTPGGVVLGNIWSRDSNRLHDEMVRTYQEVFDDLMILDVEAAGNEILIALPKVCDMDQGELAHQARRIGQERAFPFDLSRPITYGYQRAREKMANVRVLKDRDKK